jgi:hypothetical protein
MKHESRVIARLFLCGVSGQVRAQTFGVFRDMPHARTGETPYIQRHHFGAAIALGWPGDTWFIA